MDIGSFTHETPTMNGEMPPVFFSSDGYRVTPARTADVPAIAALFTEAFRDSVIHHCGKIPKPQAMQDVFTLVYEAEPDAALVVRTGENTVVGYCFAPTRLYRLWRDAVLHGHVFRWAWRWLTGRYGFGLYPVKVLFLNKLSFITSALTPAKTAGARILSIAVSQRHRGRGLAYRLMQSADAYFLKNQVERVRLEVRPDNFPALAVYEKCGYRVDGRTRDSQGDWLIMFKEMRHTGNV